MTKDEALKMALVALGNLSHADSIFAGEFDKEVIAIEEALVHPIGQPLKEWKKQDIARCWFDDATDIARCILAIEDCEEYHNIGKNS